MTPDRRIPLRVPALAGAAILALSLAACGGGGGGELEVSGAWARNSPMVATAGAVYLEIANGGEADDALTAASVDASVAGEVEIHETVAAMPSDGGMGGASGEAMMEMRPVDEIAIPAGETVALEPGGYHIMLVELAEPLEVGDEIELTLTFEEAGDVVVTAEVRETAP